MPSVPDASGRPYPPLPPLPPLPNETDGSGSGSSGAGGSGGHSGKTIAASVGGACGGLALIAALTVLALRRRRTRRRTGQGLLADSGEKGGRKRGGMKERLMSQGRRLNGLSKMGHVEGDFFLMKMEDDDDDEYDRSHESRDDYDDEVAAAMAKYRKSQPLVVRPEAGSSAPEPGIGGEERPGHDRDSTISYPPNTYVSPSLRHSASYPAIYSDDDYTMSSMRSSFETSSVVRQYWAASMAARTERLLEGHPPSTNYFDDDRRSASESSQSRKADIMSIDESFTEGGRSSTRRPLRQAPGERHNRSTVNSLQSYLRRSMSMSLTSIRSGESTTDDESMHRHQRGFRASINTEYLDHLNIKALQSEHHQMAAYRHYYRRNPTLTMSTVDRVAFMGGSRTMTTANSQRTSTVPSLTSTNDPFQSFDSNEALTELDPFSDHQYALESNDGTQGLCPRPSSKRSMLSVVNSSDDGRSNSALLRSFPTPPEVSS
ncbi:hypothetical protein BGZ58_000359 [Dissophora ornata]|nr:hypothetical protein BGZ58_000359 [Dissophora ornata]